MCRIETVPPSEVYNQLIRAYVSRSIPAKEFLSLLTEKTSIVPSDKLLRVLPFILSFIYLSIYY